MASVRLTSTWAEACQRSCPNDAELLKAALRAEDALIVVAQATVASYLAKEIEAAELVDRLIRILDGPEQRAAQKLAREALTEPTF